MPDPTIDSKRDPIADPAPGGATRPRETNLDPIAEPHEKPTGTTVAREAFRPLDSQIGRYREIDVGVAEYVELALGAVVGDRFGLLKRDEKAAFIEKVRFLLLRCDHRIICPECGQPSLPYFLSGTKTGTFQLQHKQVKPTTHVVYGPRGKKFTFPQLTLVHVEPAELNDAEK